MEQKENTQHPLVRNQTFSHTSEEYLNNVYKRFLKQVKETNWGADEECSPKPRGRKPKQVTRPNATPRTEGERRVAEVGQNKFFNFH